MLGNAGSRGGGGKGKSGGQRKGGTSREGGVIRDPIPLVVPFIGMAGQWCGEGHLLTFRYHEG